MTVSVSRPVDDPREKALERAMSRHHYSGDALIEVLHTAQELYGHLTPGLLQHVSRKLKLPPSHVLGVATFYHLFRLEPRGEHTFVVCLGTACYVAGADRLLHRLEKRTCRAGETTADGRVSVRTARCIGGCSQAPLMVCDGEFVARVSEHDLDEALDQAGA